MFLGVRQWVVVGLRVGWLGGALVVGAAGCGASPGSQARGPDPCAVARADAGGPLTDQIERATDPVEVALVRIREARLTSDPGFYTLAEQGLRCALVDDPGDVRARRWLGHVQLQFHRFAEAEVILEPLARQTGHWRDLMMWSDAKMERGDLPGAQALMDEALASHPSLETLDRAAHLSWLQGELDLAIRLQERAVSAGTAADPEPLAWALVRLGELKALRGETPNELGLALRMLPDYAPAHLALGRWLLAAGDPDAAAPHLLAAGPTVAARRALAEIDPETDVHEVGDQDPRGYAIWLADHDPERALELLAVELDARQDAVTRMARGWALHHAGRDGAADARAALATGIADPSIWVQGAVVLSDPELAERALQARAGLLPAEIICAESVVSEFERDGSGNSKKIEML